MWHSLPEFGTGVLYAIIAVAGYGVAVMSGSYALAVAVGSVNAAAFVLTNSWIFNGIASLPSSLIALRTASIFEIPVSFTAAAM